MKKTINNSQEPPVKAYKNLPFLKSTDARTIRILSEYIEPLSRLRTHRVNSTVLFFGSARANPEDKKSPLHRYYWEAEELAHMLASWAIPLKPKGKNFVICTGGGPGIMEAANRGASRAGGMSIGMNIAIPLEQKPNPYITPDLAFIFHYFFMRKFWLVYKAKAIIAFPGGFGTMDEVFEVLTLIQTKKMNDDKLTVVLYGESYWNKLVNFEHLVRSGTISEKDLRLFHYANTPEEAFSCLKRRLLKTL
jgi:uncharacterized protein (TIGR00730 family)